MIKQGYKVVEVTYLGFLMSSSQTSIVHHGARTYIPKKKTFPLKGFGPLVVFTNLEAARKYKYDLDSDYNLKIFTCEYEESEMDYVFDKCSNNLLSLRYLVDVYMRYLNVSDVASASWVKIIKEVK